MHLLYSPQGHAGKTLTVAGRTEGTEKGVDPVNCGWNDISGSPTLKLNVAGFTKDGAKVDLTGSGFTVEADASGEISNMDVTVTSG